MQYVKTVSHLLSLSAFGSISLVREYASLKESKKDYAASQNKSKIRSVIANRNQIAEII